MIFNVFLLLFAIGIIFFIAGYAIDMPVISLVGSVLIFAMGVVVMSGDVEIQTGENITNTINDNGTVVSQQKVDVYENYDFGKIGKTGYGVLFMILGAFLFIISLTSAGD